METRLHAGWYFQKLQQGSCLADAEAGAWHPVDLPHDFLISQAEDLYETCDGWYKHILSVPAEWLEQSVLLQFDGVYMDCDVILNGEVIGTHHYGYTCFHMDLTGKLNVGDNVLHVHIRHQSPNSRWYSGAGIYRDVVLHVLPKRHIALDGIYLSARRMETDWLLEIHTEWSGVGSAEPVIHTLSDGMGFSITAEANPDGDTAETVLHIQSARIWQLEDPFCYTLTSVCGGQTIRQHVGLREISITPDKGLFLNGKHVKLHGVCLHHDLGCLGSAFHLKAARRQLMAMKRMGVNSIRTSHNPPAKQIMNLCDEMGILVVSEILDMWQQPKTTYDYARFFDDDIAADVAAWVRRDRNHPSLLMWSIGNEIGDTNNTPKQAALVTQMLCDLVRQHDPKRNGLTTIGSNYMPWAGAQQCAQYVDVVGYNYGEKLYEMHHTQHPEWIIYGSETGSVFSSRGIYHFPMAQSIMSDEDLQCSALGNSCSSWGAKSLPEMIVNDLNCEYSLGQYLWSGIDYIGEPTPYHTRSCYFGAMDTAVFPKDFWYLFKSLWTNEGMVHIGVHWDWNPGQMIDIPVMTNGACAELFLNGVSLGAKQVDQHDGQRCMPTWRIPFAAGTLKAVAYDAQGRILAEDSRQTPGDAKRIVLAAEGSHLIADGEDLAFVTITVTDENGLPVDNAGNHIQVKVSGAGMLMGLDNGDSTDTDGYQVTSRRLFSGKLLAVIDAGTEAGIVRVEATSLGLDSAVLELPVMLPSEKSGNGCVSRHVRLCRDSDASFEVPVRKIELVPMREKLLTPDCPGMQFKVVRYPLNATYRDISLRITNLKGIESPCAACVMENDIVTVTAVGDGDIFLRASCCNGASHPRVISQQEIEIRGLGQPNLNPYSFISAGLYDVSEGEIGSGNEQGIAFARDGESMVGFTGVDFGPIGSDKVTLPIFALDSSLHELKMWDGLPGRGGVLLAVLPYQKPSRWNVYQEETYHLPVRLTGIHTICFSLTEKVHMKGFVFAKQSRAWQWLSALEADSLYGDTFTKTSQGVMGIGNNVSLVYENMDFGHETQLQLILDGCTPLEENPITIRVCDADGDTSTSLAQFKGAQRGLQTFSIDVRPGVCTVSFVFLPGCNFDFYGFRFDKPAETGM